MLIEALLAKGSVTAVAHATAGSAAGAVASGTSLRTGAAGDVSADAASVAARRAELGAAGSAALQVVAVDEIGAVAAGDPVPVGEGDVGAPGVVGRQDAGGDRERVEEPAVGERPLERDEPVAGAQPLVAHVGVGDVSVGPRGARFERHDPHGERVRGDVRDG
ncbi:MAG TPA: hypothetical protein PKA98_15995, partial [Acidimicrobiales bacterium]|nr:hypothetical protein [Acidimicrobiales bacterium]